MTAKRSRARRHAQRHKIDLSTARLLAEAITVNPDPDDHWSVAGRNLIIAHILMKGRE
jgi:hypothetical protein